MSKTPRVAPPLTFQITATTPAKRFFSEIELEASFGIPRKTLQNWRMLGRGPRYRKFGAGVRYDIQDVELWIQNLPTGGAGVPSCAVGER